MSEKKPRPLNPPKNVTLCPVCGEVSYSRAGVHPQCSARQEDQHHRNRLKREQLLAEPKDPPAPTGSPTAWQKRCPKCQALQHVRKSVCSCGHPFAVTAAPPPCEGELT